MLPAKNFIIFKEINFILEYWFGQVYSHVLTLYTMPTKEEIEERKHFYKILQAFKSYERDSKNRLERTKLYYERIPSRHRNLLAEGGFEDHLEKIKKCIETNYKLILQFIGKFLFKYLVTSKLNLAFRMSSYEFLNGIVFIINKMSV